MISKRDTMGLHSDDGVMVDISDKMGDAGNRQQPMEMTNDLEGDVVEGVVWEKGQIQPPAYRDKWYAVAFFFQIMAVAMVAVLVGVPEIQKSEANSSDFVNDQDNNNRNDTTGGNATGASGVGVLMFILISSLAAVSISAASLFLMHRFAESCVKTAFIASPVLFILIGVGLIMSNDDVAMAFAFVWFLLAFFSICFAWFYWSHIPFASANLQTGLSAIGAHYGVVTVSFLVVGLGTVFSVVWWIAVYGVVLQAPTKCRTQDDDVTLNSKECEEDFSNIYFVILLFCYYWTHYTLSGITRVTVAGTVGTWWFEPDANARPSCCSGAVRDSLMRSVTYSLGSICMGSLIVAVVQTLKSMVRNRRRDGAGAIILCIIECLLACIRDILEYINHWAFVYVGLYGYGFIDAARNVFQLFRSRGWNTITTNALINRTLFLVTLVVGSLTGLVSVVVGYFAFGRFSGVSYVVGSLFGIVLSSIMLTTVDGAVKTSIVCFAEAPQEFSENHPILSNAMQEAYSVAYPTIFATPPATTTSATIIGGSGPTDVNAKVVHGELN